MSNELVRYECHRPAVVLTLNRPDRRNALSRDLIAALTEAFQRACDDAAARCVILTGAGNAFCAGMDLAELQESLTAGKGKQGPVWDDALHLAALVRPDLPLAQADHRRGQRRGGGRRSGTGDGVRSGRGGAGSTVRLSRSASRSGGGDGHAASAAPRRRTHWPAICS